MERTYKVTYAADSLDSNPTIKIFDCHGEMSDWISEEIDKRISFMVQHWPYQISNEDLAMLEEQEKTLIHIEEV